MPAAKKTVGEPSSAEAWAALWLDTVADDAMTQRRLTAVERHGGVEALKRAAKARGVHLVLLTDDEGNAIVAASRHPFEVLC